jgi:hypothetical protein
MTNMSGKVLPTHNVSGSPGGREMRRMPDTPSPPKVPPMQREFERADPDRNAPPMHKREFPNADG